MLVTTEELAGHLADPSWVIFDCRHDLMEHGRGSRLYAAGHIPGAHFASVETELSGVKTGRNGRHPLPERQAFAAFLARHGVSENSTVVAYDDAGGLYAARLWWLARWIGFQRAAILDGGLPKWIAEGRPLEHVQPVAMPAKLSVKPSSESVWTADDVAKRSTQPQYAVIDARAPERFRGEVEPIDKVAGHIPGALNRPHKLNLKPDLTFRPAAEIRAEFQELMGKRSPENIAHQCGSGITACSNLFAMDYAGLKGSKLYAGSWSEWISDSTRPIVGKSTGDAG